ncbi:MAG: NAD(P)-binding protein [Leptospiraceae bacterium]|nr:NAD(P)-binding protein [Leptospiraceae bacterium]
MPTDKFSINRKQFLKITGLTGIGLLGSYYGLNKFLSPKEYSFTGKISGANFKMGHLLRTGISEIPKETKTIDTIIVGGGISGLSAGWYLQKNKFKDFLILEMDGNVGGNSSFGKNNVSKYPYGAHYVPLPSEDAKYVREFFEEVGIIEGYKDSLPVYNEFFLCADPNERLFFQGHWQEGLVPSRGIQPEDKIQYKEFFSYLEILKTKKGKDGKSAFTIPLEFSSKDKEFLDLDKISMFEFLQSKKWTSDYLNWYVEYCCRDDYGVSHKRVSAWAGLHYFASRTGKAANADTQTVLTWPEGNGFLVDKLKEINENKILTNSLVYQITIENKNKFMVDIFDSITNSYTRYITKNIIYASPRYTAKKIIKDYTNPIADTLEYSPWFVANITLNNKPAGNGVSLSWDNVSYYSRSLGYIVANHQDLTLNRKQTVITYYLPLDTDNPKTERISAYRKSYEDWLEILLPDLEKMHPGITTSIEEIDFWVWGHGMVSPGIDFLWSDKRKKMLENFQGIEFAHSDMSGISIFEEAQFRGCEAAKRVLERS